ncbi:MAG: FtsX-like permease family protein [Bacteroidota bacterium]|nr:FtsX-like permease family protein [Bacteroidota bacterium]
MKKYIKIAWRNLKRNRGRTIITISAVTFATFFALVMRSFQLGAYDNMINNFVEMSSGFVIIEHPNYENDPILENTIIQSQKTEDIILKQKNVKEILPKLSYFALGSYHTQTKGVLINGIDTEKQNKVSKISDKLVKFRLTPDALTKLKPEVNSEVYDKLLKLKGKSYTSINYFLKTLKTDKENTTLKALLEKYTGYPGRYLTPGDEGVVVGSKLAEYLNLNTGDTLVLLGSGFRAVTAADKFPIRGIVQIPNPKLDRTIVYSSLVNVQDFLSASYTDTETGEEKFLLNSYALDLYDRSEEGIKETKKALTASLISKELTVKTWKESNKVLAQQIESDDKGGQMILWILYIVIAFGIFGTVLMMTAERKREMGVMIAIGMKKIKLSVMIAFELFFLGLIGVLSGMALSAPLIILGYYRPITLTGEAAESMRQMGFEPKMPTAWFGDYMIDQAIVVLVILIIVSIYPLISIRKLKVSNALRS